jgi:hypothetical protein
MNGQSRHPFLLIRLIYWGDYNTTNNYTKILLQANEETGVKVNIEQTKLKNMVQNQNQLLSQNITTRNKSYENVYKYMCLETMLKNRNELSSSGL